MYSKISLFFSNSDNFNISLCLYQSLFSNTSTTSTTIQYITETSLALTLMNTFNNLNSQIIRLAQGHSANKDTHVWWAPDMRAICQYFLYKLDTMLGTLSILKPFSICQILIGLLILNSGATPFMSLLRFSVCTLPHSVIQVGCLGPGFHPLLAFTEM